MADNHSTKNYFAHGGNELVIGGKLTFLPGAIVEGGDGLFDLPAGSGIPVIPDLPDSTATSVAALREDYDRLLAALCTAGVMANADVPGEGGGGGDG